MQRTTSGTDGGRGTIRAVFLAQERGTPMKRVPQARAIETRGMEGCRHAEKKAGGKRQVLLVDLAQLQALDLSPGVLKENLVVEGVALDSLPPGQRLRIGEALLELTEPCTPCHKMNKLRPGLLSDSWGRRGQLARVLVGGEIREGDPVELLDVNPDVPRPINPKLP